MREKLKVNAMLPWAAAGTVEAAPGPVSDCEALCICASPSEALERQNNLEMFTELSFGYHGQAGFSTA